MGQQPNIELEMADLPRPTDPTAQPRRWSPARAGELGSPDDVPSGGTFGNPGPNSGYALVLLADREVPVMPGEHRKDVVAAIAAVMSARAAALGRAPVIGDAAVAEAILGYGDGAPDDLAQSRAAAITGMAHHPAASRLLMAAIEEDVLMARPAEVAERAAAGERLISL